MSTRLAIKMCHFYFFTITMANQSISFNKNTDGECEQVSSVALRLQKLTTRDTVQIISANERLLLVLS